MKGQIQVPQRWRRTKVKHEAEFFTGWTPPTGNSESFEGDNLWANISDLGPKVLSDTAKRISDRAVHQSAIRISPAESVLFSFKLSIGQVSFAGRDMYTNEAIATFPPQHGLNSRWAYWAFPVFIPQNAGENIYGAKLLNQALIRSAELLVPPPDEQERIANFLDDKTARIDALIAEKERLLEATGAFFKARLGTAVVEGMPGSGPLVGAARHGFEAVKKGWSLVPLKHLASSTGGLTPSKDKSEFWDGLVPWVSPKDMKSYVLEDSIDHVSQLALEQTSLRLQPVNSVLVVVRGMILAHTFPVALNAVPVTINQDMKALHTKGRVSAQYLAWMLRGLQPLVLSLTEESAHGTKALRTDQWANQCVPVPPVDEQKALVSQFEAWNKESSLLLTHLNLHIARLREYRSSLISAAVTGQLDVGSFEAAKA